MHEMIRRMYQIQIRLLNGYLVGLDLSQFNPCLTVQFPLGLTYSSGKNMFRCATCFVYRLCGRILK